MDDIFIGALYVSLSESENNEQWTIPFPIAGREANAEKQEQTQVEERKKVICTSLCLNCTI